MLAFAQSNFGNFGDPLGNVSKMQQVLKALAVAANYPAGDPGAVDGVIGQATIQAIAAWASKIPKLPSAVGTVLKIASVGYVLLPDSQKQSVANTIAQYANEITVGLEAVLVLYTGSAAPPPMPSGAGAMTSVVSFRPGGMQTAAPAGKYKSGSVTRYNVSRGVWSVYSPLSGGLGYGLGVTSDGRCVGGACLGEVNPPVPAGFVKAGEEVVPPSGVPNAGQEEDKKPFWKNPYVWLGVGGVAVIGTGTYLVLRKRKGA